MTAEVAVYWVQFAFDEVPVKLVEELRDDSPIFSSFFGDLKFVSSCKLSDVTIAIFQMSSGVIRSQFSFPGMFTHHFCTSLIRSHKCDENVSDGGSIQNRGRALECL